MFKWRNPWAKRSAPSGPGWKSTGSTKDGIDIGAIISDLTAWGFEVHRGGGVQDVVHLASGKGVQAGGGVDLDVMLWFTYRAVVMGRDSAAVDLESAQRGRQVAIDLLTEYINSESTKVEEARSATTRQVIAHGQIQSQEALMVQRINATDDMLCKLMEILEKVVKSV